MGHRKKNWQGRNWPRNNASKKFKPRFSKFFYSLASLPKWGSRVLPARWLQHDLLGGNAHRDITLDPFSHSFPLSGFVSTLGTQLTHCSQKALENDWTKAATDHEEAASAVLLSLGHPATKVSPSRLYCHFYDASNQPSLSKQRGLFCCLRVGGEGWQYTICPGRVIPCMPAVIRVKKKKKMWCQNTKRACGWANTELYTWMSIWVWEPQRDPPTPRACTHSGASQLFVQEPGEK